jgi:hypothetical protein
VRLVLVDSQANVIARCCYAAFAGLWVGYARTVRASGLLLTSRARNLHRLKNRTALPQAADFDTTVTLDALLQPGNDRDRWSTDRAARIQGQVIDVAYAGLEATNCYNPCRRDIHILIATEKRQRKPSRSCSRSRRIYETGRTQQKMNWSEENSQGAVNGTLVRV